MTARVILGDCLDVMRQFPDGAAQMCVTSPPYYNLRDYGMEEQIGLEDTPEAFIARLVDVFREVRRVLAEDGTLWVNIGDSYVGGGGFAPNAPSNAHSRSGAYGAQGALKTGGVKPQNGLKSKDLIGIPWMLAFALRADGWHLRQDIIWAKPSPMPESVTDRCTKSHEYVFLLSKKPNYFYDAHAIREQAVTESGGRNKRSVWNISARPFSGAHFATMPVELASMCILAGSRLGDTVLDPFMGAFTTAYAALQLGRDAIGAELNPEYLRLGERRIRPLLQQPALLGAS